MHTFASKVPLAQINTRRRHHSPYTYVQKEQSYRRVRETRMRSYGTRLFKMSHIVSNPLIRPRICILCVIDVLYTYVPANKKTGTEKKKTIRSPNARLLMQIIRQLCNTRLQYSYCVANVVLVHTIHRRKLFFPQYSYAQSYT